MLVLRWFSGLTGGVIVAFTWLSMINSLIVPRRTPSLLQKLVGRANRKFFSWVAGLFDDYMKKDRVLAYFGPAGLLLLLFTWQSLFFAGYSLMVWAVAGGSFGDAMRETGSSMLTLGIAARPGAGPHIVYFSAGATGLAAVALLIAYLPTLYGAFSRRETLVTMLQSRAGAPAWGPEILARHRMVSLHDDLPSFYGRWEEWSADVAESHTTYPILIFFRAPHPLRSWIVGLLSVLDSAALYLALCPDRAPTQARLCLRMGFTCLREVADAIGLDYDPDPLPDDPIELTFEEFRASLARLDDVGFAMDRSPEEAWPHFRGWRVNYEAIAYAICDAVVAPPGPWSGERTHLPGMAIVPRRPPNRQPDEPAEAAEPKSDRQTWRLRG
ncbi:MAG: hypothetical protein ACRDJV_14560 [Actinomycetota bacterium]